MEKPLILEIQSKPSNSSETQKVPTKKPPLSPRPQSASPKPSIYPSLFDCEPPSSIRHHSHVRPGAKVRTSKNRVRSSSAGRSPDLRARYWALLFENLRRAVDEIYQTCELDQSELECEETILILENYSKDFRSLTKWLKLSKDLENGPKARPTSLAWEIRKSTPAKGFLKNFFPQFACNPANHSTKSASLLERTLMGTPAIKPQSEDKSSVTNNPHKEETGLAKSSIPTFSSADDHPILASIDIKKVPTTADLHTIENTTTNSHANAEPKPDADIVPPLKEEVTCLLAELTCVAPLIENIGENTVMNNSESVLIQEEAKEIEITTLVADNTAETEVLSEKASTEETSAVNDISTVITNKPSTDTPSELPSFTTVVNATEVMLSSSVDAKTLPASESSTMVPILAQPSINPPVTVSSLKTVPPLTDNKISTGCNTEVSSFKNAVTSQMAKTPVVATTGTNTTPLLNTMSNTKSTVPNNRIGNTTSRAQTVNDAIKRNASFQDRRPFTTGTGGGGRGTANFRGGPNQYQNRSSNVTNFRRQPVHINSKQNYGSVPSKQVLPLKAMTKNEQKTGSTSSISSTSSCQSWADKVKGVTPLDSSAELGSKEDVSVNDDNDGWETVHRGRTRSRNSPVKKIASESNLTLINDKTKMNSVKPLEFRSNSDLHEVKRLQGNKKLVKCVSSGLQVPKKSDLTNKEPEKQTRPFLKRDTAAPTFRSMSNLKQKQFRVGNSGGEKPVVAGKTNTLSNLNWNKPNPKLNKDSSVNLKTEEKSKIAVNESAILKSDAPQVSEKMNQLSEITECNPANISHRPAASNTKSLETIENHQDNVKKNTSTVTLLDCTQNLDVEITVNNADACQKPVAINTEDSEVPESVTNVIESSEKQESQDEVSLNELNSNDCSSASLKLSSMTIEASLQADSSADDSDLNDDDIDDMDALEELETADEGDDLTELMLEEADRINQLGLSWGEQMDQLDLELRTPGRALQVHEKLSSPFKKRSLSETIRLQEEKQAKAQEQRERLLVEKQQRLKGKVQKAEEKKAMMEEQLEQKRLTMAIKLQKAEEKRKLQILNRIRKARDEEEKVNEIAFINTLEAQNKRHDLLSREKDHEARLSELQEERHKRLEEKAAKEVAAEERRKTLESERLARLEELKERRKLRDMKIEQQLQEKEKERLEMANQKAREREQRISALNAAQIASAEELQKKIQQKQEESARRHEENMEQIRQKAFELSVRRYSSNNDDAPRLVPYETKKMCSLCSVLIGSEVYLLSHLRGKKHRESVKDQHQGMEPSTEALELYNIKHIVDATSDQLNPELSLDKERQKALKKRCKKIRQRMINRGSEWEKENIEKNIVAESDFKQKYQKHVKEIRKHITSLSNGSWENSTVTSLERALGEFERSLDKGKNNDRLAFRGLGGMSALIQLLELALKNDRPEISKLIPLKTMIRACTVFRLACEHCFENSQHSLHTNKVVVLLDLLMQRLNILLPDNANSLYPNTIDTVAVSIPTEPFAGALLSVLATAMTFVHQVVPANVTGNSKMNNETMQRIQDVVSYTVSMGIVDKLSHYLSNVQAPIDSEPQACDFLLQIIEFMSSLAKLMDSRYESMFESKKEDNSQLLATFRVTQLGGAVSLLYGTLLHSGAPTRGESPPPQLPRHTEAVSLAALRMLNYMAMLELQLFQTVLGDEGLSLQLRHIASYLLWYSSHWSCLAMLHEVILLVGHFTVLSSDNQSVVHSGQRPTILQQLSALPFPYFSDPELTEILFPTLIACCFDHTDNKVILEQDMSTELLANYLEGCLLDVHKVTALGLLDSKKKNSADESARWMLSSRFPKNKWTAAKKFFSDSSAL